MLAIAIFDIYTYLNRDILLVCGLGRVRSIIYRKPQELLA
jgi:hypothetical protein